jgi:hypothetical protein
VGSGPRRGEGGRRKEKGEGRNKEGKRKNAIIERKERYQDEMVEIARRMGVIWPCLDLGLLWNPEVPVEESGTNYVDNNVHPANTKVSPTGRSATHSVIDWDSDVRVTIFEPERSFEKLIGGGQSAVLASSDGGWVDEVATGLRDVG